MAPAAKPEPVPQEDPELAAAAKEGARESTQSSDTESVRSGQAGAWARRGRRLSLLLAVGCAVGLAFVLARRVVGSTAARQERVQDKEAVAEDWLRHRSLVNPKHQPHDVKDGEDEAPVDLSSTEHAWKPGDTAPSGHPTAEQLKAAELEVRSSPRKELTFPEVLRSPVELELAETTLPTPWIKGSFQTRAYKAIPGPTIRVAAGETLKVCLTNKLGPGPGYEACDKGASNLGLFMNPASICFLNHTNFHTHGLHVSPEGKGDNIFNAIAPGEKMCLDIPIPKNHMAGTHWYHPHHHHATAAQAGGGAHGALIVDDPPSYLPYYVQQMQEVLCFLSLVNIPKAMRMEAWGVNEPKTKHKQVMWRNSAYPDWKWTPIYGIYDEHLGGMEPRLVVNGQYRPKLTLEDGKWYRFRFVFASIEQRIEVYQANDRKHSAFCYYQLIAKDGIYLHEAPRQIQRIYLVSGSRADIAVSCTCRFLHEEHEGCHTHLNFTAKWQPMGAEHHAITMAESTSEFMKIEVKGQRTEPEPLKTFSVRRPCYLADLSNAWVPYRNRHQLELPQIVPMMVKFDGKGKVWGSEIPPPLAHLPLGQIQEWKVKGILYHPIHLHVNPFQIVQVWDDPYYHVRDWHDTFLPTSTGYATIRINLDRFPGKMVSHCHLLEHEDNGMMAYFNVTGEEGTTDHGAWFLDPQCYNDWYPGPPLPPMPPLFR